MSTASRYQPTPYVRISHPEWSKNATIYQINTRQFTAEGTFRAAQEHLPRLRELGAVILWLMPVQVIGEKNRKGTLGSPYAVKDYYQVEPDLGNPVRAERLRPRGTRPGHVRDPGLGAARSGSRSRRE